ncbi:CAP domain-containing protein, partial [Streptomyces olivochromogenes]|nr:CAP domain-containing protein [Streptomyces olivochromogenes]
MGKHRKKQHYRRMVIATVATGIVGVPSVALACSEWPDGGHPLQHGQNSAAGQWWSKGDWGRQWNLQWDHVRNAGGHGGHGGHGGPRHTAPTAPAAS